MVAGVHSNRCGVLDYMMVHHKWLQFLILVKLVSELLIHSYGGAVKPALHSSGHTGLTIAAGTGSDGNILADEYRRYHLSEILSMQY